jgi:hypothetical protein
MCKIPPYDLLATHTQLWFARICGSCVFGDAEFMIEMCTSYDSGITTYVLGSSKLSLSLFANIRSTDTILKKYSYGSSQIFNRFARD